ncbi:olfactory receptor 10A3-like [Polyodon spathula]|uniref:olfactory receptor 10A3-like n=1 Tax=Polyodon spathula TaxID=7913 RepID=UPI001B7E9202|nr:olfactory receptor 10A3-like [Polyodon spathula]
MENASHVSSFTLTAFGDMGNNKYIYFAITLIGYLFIISVNSCFILLIILQKSLHEPMYICLCNLFMNALLGTASFYPSFLYHLLSDTQVISYEFCYTQMCVMYTYIMGEMTILTAMAYDRYVAIYLPLKYNTVMTCTKLYKLLLAAWIYPVVMVSFAIIFSVSVPLCGNQINKLYCHNWDVLKLSCVDTTVNNIYGFLVYASFIPLFSFTVYSYIKILTVCHNSSKEHNRKALQTCLPHLISLISFYATVLTEMVQSRLNPKNVSNIVRTITSLELLIVPPLLNPIIYCLILPEIRKRVVKTFRGKQIGPKVTIPNATRH